MSDGPGFFRPSFFLTEAYIKFPYPGPVIPALGYSAQQCQELQQTIDRCGADVILDAGPCRLSRILDLKTRLVRVSRVSTGCRPTIAAVDLIKTQPCSPLNAIL